MRKINFPRLIASLFLPFAAAVIGSFFTAPAIDSWYQYLDKPALSPPNWIFGPVWTLLYFMMGIVLYLIWEKYIKLFIFHLLINAFWSIAFFGLQEIFLALVVIIALWGIILFMIIRFSRINRLASLLLYPYLAWVSFAIYLNMAILFLNS